MVATDACSCATWDSSAMVTLSRKRRCTRVLTVRRNHVAAVDTPWPISSTTLRLTAVNLISSQVAGVELNRRKSARSDQIGLLIVIFYFLSLFAFLHDLAPFT